MLCSILDTVSEIERTVTGPPDAPVLGPAQDWPVAVEELDLADCLRTSLSESESVVPYFQPIVSLYDLAVVGHEGLVRWHHPTRGTLAPAAFLALAERTGLVVPLGWNMLERCCAALSSSSGAGQSGWISVNVSGSQLGRGQLVPAVCRSLDASGIEPGRLHLEITETALVKATATIVRELGEVSQMGVAIALDDFGTGYSSLSMLRDLPVNAVKVDRSFIETVGYDHVTTAIVHRVIELCRDLGIDLIAEGIETDVQASILRALGCTFGQGYLFGLPAPYPCRSPVVHG
jgi:diguanylate cyclase